MATENEIVEDTAADTAVLDLVKSIKDGMLTRDAVAEIAEELVSKKLTDLAERNINFSDDSDGEELDTKGDSTIEIKKEFTPDEQKDLDYVFLYKSLLGADSAATSPWVAETLEKVYGKEMFTKAVGTSSTYATLIPTGLSPQLEKDVTLQLLVADKFRVIDMPTNPFKLPTRTGRTTAYHVAESGNATESTMTTGDVTLTLEKLATYTQFTYEVEADAIVPVLGMLRDDIVDVLARQIDDNILNGTDVYDSAGGQLAVYGTWDGLKTIATAQGTVQAAAGTSFASTDVMSMRNDLKTRGVRTDDLVLFASTTSYNDLLEDTNVKTVDKFGPNATILKGQVAAIYGVPIILSEFVDTTTTNQGSLGGTRTGGDLVLASRSAFVIGRPQTQGILVEQDKNIVNQTVQLVASIRRDFQKVFGDATNPSVAHRYIA